jgi:hypothetical protein
MILEVVRYRDPTRDVLVRGALIDLGAAGIKPKLGTVQDGVLTYLHRKGLRSPDPVAIAAELGKLVAAVKAVSPPPRATCGSCGTTLTDPPLLVNGMVDRMCPQCIERLQEEGRRAQASYDAQPFNFPFALVVAGVLAVVGAGIWAAVAITTHRMFWALGIGIGVLVGFGTAKAAGKIGLPVQVIGALFTILSVLLGQVFFAAYQFHEYAKEQSQTVDWRQFALATPQALVSMGGDTLFALGGGLLGAYYVLRAIRKPQLVPTVTRLEPQ